jgi:hypothetical protein
MSPYYQKSIFYLVLIIHKISNYFQQEQSYQQHSILLKFYHFILFHLIMNFISFNFHFQRNFLLYQQVWFNQALKKNIKKIL